MSNPLSQLERRPTPLGAVRDKQFWRDVRGNALTALGGLGAGAVGAPVDLATLAMRPFGYSVPQDRVVGSSDWVGRKMGMDTESAPFIAGSMGPTPDAMDAVRLAGLVDPNALLALGGATRLLGKSDVPRESRRLTDIGQSDRYDIFENDPADWQAERGTRVFSFQPKGLDEFKRLEDYRGRPMWVDESIAEVEKVSNPVEMDGKTIDLFRYNTRLKDGWLADVPAKGREGVVYRGVSAEEYESIMKTGQIKSRGGYNLDGQEGLTYYSTDPRAASHYAHSFAPVQHQSVPGKPAYVIAVKDPGNGVKIAGTGEHEVGVPGSLSASDIVEVWEGRVYRASQGEADLISDFSGVRDGSYSGPNTAIAWKKVE